MSYGATADESPAASTAGYPTVVIIGRPNVGKSTFFNRLVGHRRALVEDLPGTTRDRLYGQVRWQGRTFAIADTGGWQPEERPTPRDRRSRGDLSEELTTLVRRQVETALDEADVILFMVDAKEGMTAADREIGQLLREAGRPLLILANKADNEARLQAAQEFYELALGEPIPISAHHGLGVAEALDRLLEILPLSSGEEGLEGEASALPLAIVGRPNVGKSLLLNALLGWERAIVSEVPGTTRDAIDTPFTYDGRRLILIDTAGLRRRSRRREDVERHAALRSERAIRRADVALLVLDATEPATDQDTNIARAVVEAHKGLVLVVNKWDLIGLGMAEGQGGLGNKGDQQERAAWAQAVRHRLSFVSWAPLCFISALNRQG
ncbi:MAG TPA: ribosome biogenesis GTPase Der, partial [Dehalococcoidia bacterium]|nr:ribosome biogenesis GTPase Der [Dehalococcoidia bacterium]